MQPDCWLTPWESQAAWSDISRRPGSRTCSAPWRCWERCWSSRASLGALLANGDLSWTLPSGVPYLTYSVRLDPLSAYFNLTLSLLAAAVSVYSSATSRSPAGKSPSLFCAWLNLLLLSLTLVFTASNVVFFLIAWELMVVSSYFLVVFDHESAEARHGGLLYLLMSRARHRDAVRRFPDPRDGGGQPGICRLCIAPAGTFRPSLGGFAFVLLFLGFGVKAGIIPLHIWLPAAHPVAPSNVSALMSGIVIKTGIYGMARVFFDFYGDLPPWAGMLVLTDRRGLGAARRSVRPDGARSQAPAGVPQHREHRDHSHGLRFGAAVPFLSDIRNSPRWR